ncbi:integrase, catalytic region, zinc finger, CCHC-type containing protein [Tanacetum coccineum]
MSEKAKDPEVIAKKISHKPIDYENLNSVTDNFEKCFSPQQELSAEQAFWFHTLNPTIEPSYTPPVIVDVLSELPKCLNLDVELSKLKQAYNDLLKNYSQLEKHCISLKVSMQLKQEVFQNDDSYVSQNVVEIPEYFEINDLKARQQDKDTTICKLKDTIKSLRENTKEEKVNPDKCDLEPINKELENRKEIVENVVHTPSATTIALGMFKLDLEPLPHRLLQNREVHIDYLRNTQEQANNLWEIVEQAKAKQPLDSELDFACKYATRIQELLVYIQDTYPNAIIPSAKKDTVKPMNNVKKVRSEVLSRLFGNDQIARIMGYGDYQLGNVIISRVYYIEGLGHNLFSIGQFCDADLEVAFQKNTCFIRNLEGVDLLLRSRDTNLYIISLDDMLKSSPICLLSKASKTKSWLWHRQLSHLNFGTLNKLAKVGLARGIPRLKFQKDHLCSACALGKSKKSSHQPKAEETN